MASEFLNYIIELKAEEIRETYVRQGMRQMLDEAIIARFPEAPYMLVHTIGQVKKPEQLRDLMIAVMQSIDIKAFEQQVTQIVATTDTTDEIPKALNGS